MNSEPRYKANRHLIDILTIYSNNFDTGNIKHVATIHRISKVLDQFGNVGNRACLRYKVTAKSNFYDHAHLMDCLRAELRTALPATQVWGNLLKAFKTFGTKVPLQNPIVIATIDSLGGLQYLGSLKDFSFERKRFIDTYESLVEASLNEQILAAEQKVNNVTPS